MIPGLGEHGAPWRDVEGARLRAGRGSVLGPATTRRARWWVLELSCGHTAERDARYAPRARGETRRRTSDDVLPAPKRARCTACAARLAP